MDAYDFPAGMTTYVKIAALSLYGIYTAFIRQWSELFGRGN
jgi:uncharacterized membrane protein YobD (UPF0266 family)